METKNNWRKSLSAREELKILKEKMGEEKAEEIINSNKPKIKEKKKPTRFFNFNQNNTGGSFDEDEDLDTEVIIEAYDPEDVNNRAREIGIYFDGCSDGRDCGCCGDRWYPVSDNDKGTKKPEIYSKDITKLYKGSYRESCIVYYVNGKKKKVIFKEKNDGHKHIWKDQYSIGNQCELCEIWEKDIE